MVVLASQAPRLAAPPDPVACTLGRPGEARLRLSVLARVKGLLFGFSLVVLICFPVTSLQMAINLGIYPEEPWGLVSVILSDAYGPGHVDEPNVSYNVF